MTHCLSKLPFGRGILQIAGFVGSCTRAGKVLGIVGLVALVMIYHRDQVQVIERQVVGTTANDRALFVN